MPGLLKVDSILYRVSDLEKAREMYLCLGLKQVWEDYERKMIGFQLQENVTEIVIHVNPKIPKFSFSYSVENVENFVSEMIQKGFKLVSGPFEVRTGKFAVLKDLDDNEIPVIDLTKFGGVPRYD